MTFLCLFLASYLQPGGTGRLAESFKNESVGNFDVIK